MVLGFFKDIAKTVTKPFKDIADFGINAGKGVWKDVVKPVFNTGKDIVNTVYTDVAKPVFSTGMGIVEGVAGTAIGIVDKTASTAIEVGGGMTKNFSEMPMRMMDTLSNPLVLGAVIIGGVLVINLIRR